MATTTYVTDGYPYDIFTSKITVNLSVTQSGLFEIGKTYIISSLQEGDDFSNIEVTGGTSGVSGLPFVAIDTTPNNWGNSSSVINLTDSQPVVVRLKDTIDVDVALEYITDGLYLTFRKTNCFIEPYFYPTYSPYEIVRVDDDLAISSYYSGGDSFIKNPIGVRDGYASETLSSNVVNYQYEFKVYS